MKKTLFAICIFPLLIFSCELFNSKDFDLFGDFWAVNFVTNKFYRVDAHLAAQNDLVEIWIEQGADVSKTQAIQTANYYRDIIYPRMKNYFFWEKDINNVPMDTMQYANFLVNGDGRLTVLLLDIIDGHVPGEGFIGGYFDQTNFFNSANSNRRAMIYIDIDPLQVGSDLFYGTIAHEMQHLMNSVTNSLYIAQGIRSGNIELWINEGLSESAEWVVLEKTNPHRLTWYNLDNTGLISQGSNFFVWNNYGNTPGSVLNDYSTVYLFFQWLRLQTDNNVYQRIFTSPFTNFNAVIDALNGTPLYGKSWGDLMRAWYAANFFNNPEGKYGYEGALNVVAPLPKTIATSVSLFPGEGVFSKLNGNFSRPIVPNIKYSSLNSSGVDADFDYNSSTLFTQNINTSISGVASPGMTTGIPPERPDNQTSIPSGRSLHSAASEIYGPHRICVAELLGQKN